ncbi:MAG: aldo/keto reductase [Lachnospiraceae bacterium]|nr:aldo/keto reductase [Lachnospiraceae bacterium]
MTDIKRLGLGTMGMNLSNAERSMETIHYALDQGITIFNTGEFYGGGESELVIGQALKGIPRDKYFLSVKFGVLPKPGGGIYGLDVKPFHVKAHLAYSMHRLGLDYIDLYQPARMDETVPVEELIGALEECVKEGYIGSIGLTQIPAQTLEKAVKIHSIHTVELEYSLACRRIETNGILEAAKNNHIDVMAFGVLAHGLLSERTFGNTVTGRSGLFTPDNICMVSDLKGIADEKNTTIEKLAQAYIYAKHPDMSILIGTTSKEHLQDSIDALSLELTSNDIQRIEKIFLPDKVQGSGMRDFVFRDGRMGLK